MTGPYVPNAGDTIWLEFDPQAGHDQAGRRPAFVLSSLRYNALRGMLICCPMTSRIKGYVFEVVASRDPPSAILVDQVESLDWRARRARRMGTVGPDILTEVRAKLKALLQL